MRYNALAGAAQDSGGWLVLGQLPDRPLDVVVLGQNRVHEGETLCGHRFGRGRIRIG